MWMFVSRYIHVHFRTICLQIRVFTVLVQSTMYTCVCALCAYVHIRIYLSVYLLSICLSIYICMCIYIHMSMSLPMYIPTFMYVSANTCIYIYNVYLCIVLYVVHAYVCLFVGPLANGLSMLQHALRTKHPAPSCAAYL